eukprot:4327637-Pyramimonas_sp.AAC.1
MKKQKKKRLLCTLPPPSKLGAPQTRAATFRRDAGKRTARRARARQADLSHKQACSAQEIGHAKPAAAPKTELTNLVFQEP